MHRRWTRGLGPGLALLMAVACGTTVPLTSSGAPLGGSSDALGGVATAQPVTTGAAGAGPTAGAVTDPSTGGPVGRTPGSGPTASSPGAPVATGPRIVTPLKIGIITVEFGAALAALGASSSDTTDQDGFKALIRAVNETGGLAGRRLVPTYVKIDAADSSYQAAGDRACATFQDAKVDVVISEAASTYYGFAACLAKKGIPLISSNASDQAGFAQARWVFNPFTPSYDRGYGAVVDQLAASGYLTPQSVIGVIHMTCAEITRAYQGSVLPRMRAAHLRAPIDYSFSCANGFADAGAASAAMQSAALQFKASGVNRVFVIGDQETLLLSYFAQQAQSQDYRPGYALSSASHPITLIGASTFPEPQLPQVHGVGWVPLGDTAVDRKLPVEARCTSLVTEGGLKPKDVTEKFIVYQACSNLFLLEAALKRGNGSATGPILSAVIPTLGTSFASPGVLGGSTLFSPSRHDGPQLASEWGYVTRCSCFRYSGKPSVMR